MCMYLLVMRRDQILRELSMNVISRCTIYGNLEIREWQIPLFSWFRVKNKQIFARFHPKTQSLREFGMNGISQFRTEIACDSVKC